MVYGTQITNWLLRCIKQAITGAWEMKQQSWFLGVGRVKQINPRGNPRQQSTTFQPAKSAFLGEIPLSWSWLLPSGKLT